MQLKFWNKVCSFYIQTNSNHIKQDLKAICQRMNLKLNWPLTLNSWSAMSDPITLHCKSFYNLIIIVSIGTYLLVHSIRSVSLVHKGQHPGSSPLPRTPLPPAPSVTAGSVHGSTQSQIPGRFSRRWGQNLSHNRGSSTSNQTILTQLNN